jgi:hypothetical protein
MKADDFLPDAAVTAALKRYIAAYEAERVAAHRQVKWRVPVFLGGLVLATVALALLFNRAADPFEQWKSTPHVFLYFFALALAFWLYSVAMRPATVLQQTFRERVLPIVFGFVRDVRYNREVEPASFAHLPVETVGSFNRKRFDDIVTGSYEDFSFEVYEARLAQKSGKSESVVFKGIVMAFERPTTFPGKLVATRKTGQVASFFRDLFGRAALPEIQSGVPALDEKYDFRTDNADAARPIVAGHLAKALAWLGETWPEGLVRLAISGKDGFLLIPSSKDFFELPGISVPLDYDQHVKPIVADMAALLATASLVRKVGADG